MRHVYATLRAMLNDAVADELSVTCTYAEVALKLGTTEPALKATMQRWRRRYAELLREQIAQTVPGPQEVEDELRHLYAVLRTET